MSESHICMGKWGYADPAGEGQEHKRYSTLDWTVGPTQLSWHLLLQEAFRDLACPGILGPHVQHTSVSHLRALEMLMGKELEGLDLQKLVMC